jgi:hypothetical protein
MLFKTAILPNDEFRFSPLLLGSIKLDKGFMYLFSSLPLTSPERSLPPSTASSPLSTPPASPMSSPRLLAFPIMTNDDVPLQFMPPVQPDPPSRSTHTKRQGHANQKRRREREREAAKVESQGRIRPYKARPAMVKKHVKPSKPYATQFNSSTIPITSSGYLAVPGQNSSSKFPLQQLVGPQSQFKMQKVIWDGRQVPPRHYSMHFINPRPIDSLYPLSTRTAKSSASVPALMPLTGYMCISPLLLPWRKPEDGCPGEKRIGGIGMDIFLRGTLVSHMGVGRLSQRFRVTTPLMTKFSLGF